MHKIPFQMEPMLSIQKVLVLLCIYPENSSASTVKRWSNIVFASTIMALFMSLLAASFVSAVKFASIDFAIFFYAVYQFVVWLPMPYMMCIGFSKRSEIKALFDDLSKIYDAC